MIIRGNTVGTTVPRPDYAETDSARSTYIRNKPDTAIAQARALAEAALPRSGGTMTGVLDMGGKEIQKVGTPASDSSAANKAYVDSRKKTAVCTLGAAGWTGNSQTVSVAGVTEDNAVIMAPDSASFTNYRNFGVRCTGQGAGTLTFAYEFTPTADLRVNVLILE